MKETTNHGIGRSIDPKTIVIDKLSGKSNSESHEEAALRWFEFGLNVIPIVSGAKATVVKWDPWLQDLSKAKIANHWSRNPSHDLGFIVGDEIIVFDADSPKSIAALSALEQKFGIESNFVVKTSKGEHHYYRRGKDTLAKSDSHSTKNFPERLDVKTGRAMVVLPPSAGKEAKVATAANVRAFSEVGQEFIDAVSRHNGRSPLRPEVMTPDSRAILRVNWESTSQATAWLKALLNHLDPSIGRDDWLRVLMAISHETGGSEEGLALADTWSRNGNNYDGRESVENEWRTFDPDPPKPVTIGTIIWMVEKNGGDWIAICDSVEPQFEACDTEVINQNHEVVDSKRSGNPLLRFSLLDYVDELKKAAVEAVPVLGQVALMGQATIWYAAPNTGKTLIALNLLTQAIKLKRVDPSSVYYINVDDSSTGLADKAVIAKEYGFHMVADGYKEFSVSKFLGYIREMIEENQARGIVIILDTIKKFVDLMKKSEVSGFTKVVRSFVQMGGTMIALAHVNKRAGEDGKPIYAGTSDLRDDFDCAYTLAPVASQPESREKVVEFENTKRRGNSVLSTSYCYSTESTIAYSELVASVRPFNEKLLVPLKQAEAIKTDADVINAIEESIRGGIDKKMELKAAVAKRAGISINSALKIIEKYTGEDPTLHRWKFSVGAHGAHRFVLLESAP